MRILRTLLMIFLSTAPCVFAFQNERVGAERKGSTFVATGQWVKPAGKSIAFAGRPVDLALTPDGTTLFVKLIERIAVIDAGKWVVRQTLDFSSSAGSMHGIAVHPGGASVYVTDADSGFLEMTRDAGMRYRWGRAVKIPGIDGGPSYPCGIALDSRGEHAYVALSRNNSVAVLDLRAWKLEREIPVGIAPYDVVLSPDGAAAYVSNWGGDRPDGGERVMRSAGSDVVVDGRDMPVSGTVSKIDIRSQSVSAVIAVGLHPSDLELSSDGKFLYCANANSDNVAVIATEEFHLQESIRVQPDTALPFGSITNALALSADNTTLFAANGGDNALAVIGIRQPGAHHGSVKGYIPTGWFPSAVLARGAMVYVANAKGTGSRQGKKEPGKWHVKWNRGTVQAIPSPQPGHLMTSARRKVERPAPTPAVRPLPVPAHVGDPSVFEHVVYVLKENRTYDQIFGDIKRGNSDPRLCMYGENVTPNHHAIARQFVLLDNYYCNGIVSADGHQWATQGVTTDYQEKTWGAWTRSYDFGSDPLAFAPTDFIWENALLHGRTFRNYGEFDFPSIDPADATWSDVYLDHKHGTGKIAIHHSIPMESLRKYSCPTYPGWMLRIPDALRIDEFCREFAGYEERGDWPNLVFVYLPQDHTSGTRAGAPTPRAHLADNDLALGRLVETISKSKYWQTTCIVVIEDDPQDGFDHVDGHRSLCLVASPYTKRGKVISRFYNQTSVLHTIERILGLPPMNAFDAAAPTMEDCFTEKPDFTPFTALPNAVPIDEMNKRASLLDERELMDRKFSESFDVTRPDRCDDDRLNRILWCEAKGHAPYPAEFAGSHGKGLAPLGLAPAPQRDDGDK